LSELRGELGGSDRANLEVYMETVQAALGDGDRANLEMHFGEHDRVNLEVYFEVYLEAYLEAVDLEAASQSVGRCNGS
jgi:glutamine synthetase type III